MLASKTFYEMVMKEVLFLFFDNTKKPRNIDNLLREMQKRSNVGLKALIWIFREGKGIVTDETFDIIGNFTNLAALKLGNAGNNTSNANTTEITISDESFGRLSLLTNLSFLEIEHHRFNSTNLRVLEHHTSITNLCLKGIVFPEHRTGDESLLAHLVNNPLLRLELRCVGDGKIPESDFRYLSRFTQLNDLFLLNCERKNGANFGYITCLQNLERLAIRHDNITDQNFHQITKLSNLVSLSLGECTHLTNGAVANITALRKLTQLGILRGSLLHSSALNSICKLEIKHLRLSECLQIGTGQLGILWRSKTLEHLELDASSTIDDVGIEVLSVHPSLRGIHLSRLSNVSDVGIEALNKTSQLKRLTVDHCPLITLDALKKLAKSRACGSVAIRYIPPDTSV